MYEQLHIPKMITALNGEREREYNTHPSSSIKPILWEKPLQIINLILDR